jgi:DNA repair protein RAD50
MLGISKAILDNIVFCHQDESLWPFSDNNTLKGIFDELFDTKKFTKAVENMK